MELSPEKLSDNLWDSLLDDKSFEELCSTDISPWFPPIMQSGLSPNLQGSSNGQSVLSLNLLGSSNGQSGLSLNLQGSSNGQSGLSLNLQGSSNGQHLFADSFGHNANASPVWITGDSSNGQHLFPQMDSLKTFGNVGPQVTSDVSTSPCLSPFMSTSEIQYYDEASHYFSGHSNRNAPKTPAMHCGKKRKDIADNLEDGFSVLPQNWRRFPPFRRNSPPISGQSNHTVKINMPQGFKMKATYSMLSGETRTPDALANTSQPLQNGIPCEDRCETSTKRKGQEKETHFEEQPTEIQSNNPVRQAIVETIEGNNIPNAITDHNVVDHPTHMAAQPSLGSISTQPSSSFSSIEKTKLSFDNLIVLSLEVLSDPEMETSMIEALTILKENLPLFSEEQGDQILVLSLDFSLLVRSWREWSSKFQIHSQQSSAETENIRDLVENSGRDEESLKVRYGELEKKEKELMTQLDEVQKQKAEIAEQRTEKSKLTKDLKEKAAHRNKEERLMIIATAKLNNLSDEWAKLQSFFI